MPSTSAVTLSAAALIAVITSAISSTDSASDAATSRASELAPATCSEEAAICSTAALRLPTSSQTCCMASCCWAT
ncbi:hypothetical protein [Halobaculum rarum]|uniref:hypothetical protein n=1 Tax=Halobaculum rarum TaxID=3075122 RepID=UPI0032AF3063